jgi:branched-chain amino acid transport system permease protein
MIDSLLSGQLFVAAILTGMLYALVGLGLNLVYGTMRLLNIAHGEFVMIGAYVAFWGFTVLGLSPLVCAIGAGLLTGGIGAAFYLGLFVKLLAAPDLARRLEANSLLIFFGVSIILQNVVAFFFTNTPRGYRYLDRVFTLGNVSLTANRLAALVIATAICFGTLLFLRFSVNGLALKALIQRRDAADIVGVDVHRVQLGSIAAGFATAGIAGALISMSQEITPVMGFPFTIAAFIVIILGGLGNIVGGVVAGLVLGFIEIYGVALTSPEWNSILIYGVFVAVLLLRPQGLLGGKGSPV